MRASGRSPLCITRTVLDSTISPLTGAYTSLAAFTDSTEPNGSLPTTTHRT